MTKRKTPAPQIDDAPQITKSPTKATHAKSAKNPNGAGSSTKAQRAAKLHPEHYEENRFEPDAETAPPPRRMAPRPVRQTAREPSREPARRGAVMVQGRNGEILARRRRQIGDIHEVPLSEIPAGWDYQWNVVTVANQEFREEQQIMAMNGWRPVPAERHAGRWTEPGFAGSIIVKGLRLEERPSALGDDARQEDKDRARDQVRTQTDSLRLSKKLPEGMSTGGKYRGTGADVRMTIDKGLDIPHPEHTLADE